ncbi:hypothetical protein AcW1_003980 [Taiwanofungus camphoratus]|nr:hypothetical protein AcW1_003980 [Antrodia cinnamomea]
MGRSRKQNPNANTKTPAADTHSAHGQNESRIGQNAARPASGIAQAWPAKQRNKRPIGGRDGKNGKRTATQLKKPLKKKGVVCTPWQVNPHLVERRKQDRWRPLAPRRGPPAKCKIVPASRANEGPWKYLKKIKLMQSSESRNPPKILLARNELVLKGRDQAILIFPIQQLCQGKEGVVRWKETKKWQQIRNRRNELIVRRHGRWFYIGLYQGCFPTMMEQNAFSQLPEKIKADVCKLSVAASEASDEAILAYVARQYQSGDLRLAKIRLFCIGTNSAIQQGLEDAIAQRYRTRARSVPKSCVEMN